jgi:hypothetical protein
MFAPGARGFFLGKHLINSDIAVCCEPGKFTMHHEKYNHDYSPVFGDLFLYASNTSLMDVLSRDDFDQRLAIEMLSSSTYLPYSYKQKESSSNDDDKYWLVFSHRRIDRKMLANFRSIIPKTKTAKIMFCSENDLTESFFWKYPNDNNPQNLDRYRSYIEGMYCYADADINIPYQLVKEKRFGEIDQLLIDGLKSSR